MVAVTLLDATVAEELNPTLRIQAPLFQLYDDSEEYYLAGYINISLPDTPLTERELKQLIGEVRNARDSIKEITGW